MKSVPTFVPTRRDSSKIASKESTNMPKGTTLTPKSTPRKTAKKGANDVGQEQEEVSRSLTAEFSGASSAGYVVGKMESEAIEETWSGRH